MPKRSPEETAEKLAELIREASGMCKDLSRLLRECREIVASGEQRVREACARSGDEELREWYEHLQAEMNKNTAMLNEAVTQARKAVVRQLVPARVVPEGGGWEIHWSAGLFDDDAGVTET